MAKTHFQDDFLPSCFIILIFLQLLPAVIHGNGNTSFEVIGPDDAILAMLGEDTELSCHLSPSISAKDMELRWYRDNFSDAVFVYEKGEDVYEEQMEEYQGRTTFVRDYITKGKAAVRIHNVTVFDNGTYRCYFKGGTYNREATLQLKVAGQGLPPRVRLRGDKDESVQAECTSAGWYPQPQVEWRDFRGNTIASVTNLSVSATSGLFAVVSSVVVKHRATEGLSCSIANPLLPEIKVTASHLPAFFSGRSWPTVWRISLPLILVALGVVVAGAICVFWKKKRDIEEEQQDSSDNGGQGKRDICAVYTCVLMYVHACEHVCTCACVHACVSVSVFPCVPECRNALLYANESQPHPCENQALAALRDLSSFFFIF
ncbi:LOW QUALITY PROTEIN: butyrophilin-like protein 10 [Trichechus manatus latirostris]|uniref:LOW QUALITY PROTEIN: butyrophilin-like protein 10 n=1 Tax=Trichechus manatus latirostris TaxID=127582 RepID=A0A2Y9RML2_TRIMA|nr:LOW QUALITY PROTEIN: butyrophilin-like protein 10 [Trichechus manatus latirostris]